MFKLAASPTFIAPVRAQIPGDKGKTTTVMFHVRFKRLTQDEYQSLLRRLDEARARFSAATSAAAVDLQPAPAKPDFGDRELIDEVLCGFESDLLGEDDKPLDFSPENVDALCAIYPIQPAIVRSFFEHFGKAVEKK